MVSPRIGAEPHFQAIVMGHWRTGGQRKARSRVSLTRDEQLLPVGHGDVSGSDRKACPHMPQGRSRTIDDRRSLSEHPCNAMEEIMKTWTKPSVREQEVGLEVTSYLPAEIDII